jgi:hypothetical protein
MTVRASGNVRHPSNRHDFIRPSSPGRLETPDGRTVRTQITKRSHP